ncbi:MAG: DUF3772 domain-containing protein [Rhodobacteraceae bacterium]|nr:DUF3772 domain-containing protein [Paracoccaceae bacterium]
MIRAFLTLCLVLFGLPLWAQSEPDYEAWESVAARAEMAVSNARASDSAFEVLRAEIEVFRAEFLDAQGINTARLVTLREQLAALGPVPAEGESEADGVAARRDLLNAQIEEAAAPGIRAVEAFTRADGIIGEIDAILRERRTAALLARGPTGIDPASWASFSSDLGNSFNELSSGVSMAWQNGSAEVALRQNLPLIMVLLVVALLFVLRGRFWLVQLGRRLEADASGAGLRLSGFLVSLGQVIVPMIGLLALSRALLLTGFFFFYGADLVAAIPAFGFTLFLSRWLAGRLFPSLEGVPALLSIPEDKRAGARFTLLCIGAALTIFAVLDAIARQDGYGQASMAALSLPFFAAIGYLLYVAGRILATHAVTIGPEGEPQPSVLDRLVALLSRFAKVIGVAAPLIAAFGYVNAAGAALVPTLQSLAVFAILGLLIGVVRDAFVFLTRGKAAEESLVPVLFAMVMFVAAVPILALVWGATINDLREIWVTIQKGVTVGETTISAKSFGVLIFVFALGFVLTRFVQSALRTSVLPKTQLDIGGQTAVVSGLGYIGVFVAGLLAISAAGIDLSSLAFIAGALGVGIGFGLQNIVSNFISGIILLVERPISEGDWIEVGGNMGFVRDISVRSTRIETFDRTDVIVPNADLISGTVTNYTRGNTVGRVIVPVGVAYGTDTRRVEKILQEIAEAHPMVTLKPPPSVYFKGFGADSMDFEIRAILRDVTWMIVVHTEMNHQIAERFAAEGIEIPFAQRDVWLRNPEALQVAGAPTTSQTPQSPDIIEVSETAHPEFDDTSDPDGEASSS